MSFCFSFISLKEISSWTPGASCWASQTSSWEYQWHGPSQSVGNARYQGFFSFQCCWQQFEDIFNVCLHLLLSCTKKKLRFIETEKRIKGEAFTVYVLLLMKCRWGLFYFLFFNVIFIYPGSNHTLWLKKQFFKGVLAKKAQHCKVTKIVKSQKRQPGTH